MTMPFGQGISRRTALKIAAGGVLAAANGWPAFADEATIGRLIERARAFPHIAGRIDFISAALRGARYQAHSLIGGPRQPEKFVVRDDAFDCVTYCETVLAAAIAHDLPEFENALRHIRYHNGKVDWFARNHYFHEWRERNIENKIFSPVVMAGAVRIDKTVYWHRALGRRQFAMTVIPRAAFMTNRGQLERGDVVGFVNQRSYLDYFHTGLIAFGRSNELLVRHASQSRGRVLDEPLDRFLAINGVRYLTLLRAQDTAQVTAKL